MQYQSTYQGRKHTYEWNGLFLPHISLSIVNSSSTPRKSSSSSQRDKIDFASLLALFKQAHSDYIKRTAGTHESIVDAVALDLNAYMKNPSNLSTP